VDAAGVVLLALIGGLLAWLVYELATGQRELVRFLFEMVILYGPIAVIFGAAATLNVAVMFAVVPWMIFLLVGGRGLITRWLAANVPDVVPLSASPPLIDGNVQEARWEWTADPTIVDPDYFADWFDRAVLKDESGFYVEHLIVGPDGRVDPLRRIDGTMPMLPMFFHQVRVTPGRSTRGPTVEEFRQLVAVLQTHLKTFEFLIEEDPERRWIKYRVRR
jgi:hypothetical protein